MNGSYLEVEHDSGTEVIGLERDVLTLGRDRSNDVALPSDAAISRRHAVLERAGPGWRVRDLGSSNGTFVNGTAVEGERVLAGGDAIEIGATRLLFRAGEPAAPVAANAPAPAGYLDLSEEWRGGEQSDPTPPPAPRPVERAISPQRPAPDTREPTGSGAGRVRGVARAIQVRQGEDQRDILAFRIDRYDEAGNRMAPVA